MLHELVERRFDHGAYIMAAAVIAVVLGGCGASREHAPDAGEAVTDGSAPDGSNERFESDDPRLDDLTGDEDWDEDFCESEPGPAEGERAWREANRSALAGERIFALSPQGLTAIDATAGQSAQVVGRDVSITAPIEVAMLSDDIALVISNAPARECGLPDLRTYLTTFDVSDPADMRQLSQEELDGAYTGLQHIGDILYVRTISFSAAAVTAMNVAEPRAPVRIATRNFAHASDVSQDPVLFATSTRLYGAVQRSSGQVEIQVVPLDGVTGSLAIAATFEVQGWIYASWQLSEHDGTLRVVTASEQDSRASALETFAVSADHQVSPLARIELQPTVNQVLFDGPRAYALSVDGFDPTTERFDFEWRPIDLQDPLAPSVGEPLELPGGDSVLVPFGDRLLSRSLDVAADGSSDAFYLSLFDVSDLSAPVQLDEQHLDGQPALDVVHTSAGLVAVPFWQAGAGAMTCAQPSIEVIDLSDDALTVRGTLALAADPYRVRWLGDRLLAMTFDTAELFALDGDAPTRVGEVALARYVTQTARVGEQLVLAGTSDQSSRLFLDVQALDAKLPALATGALAWAPPDCFGRSLWISQLNVDGARVHVYYQGLGDRYIEQVATVDISDPSHPRLESDQDIVMDDDPELPYDLRYRPVATRPIEHGFVQLAARDASSGSEVEPPAARLHVLHAPGTEPPVVVELTLEESAEPHTLQTRGDQVYVGRMQARDGEAHVQFFVDRIELEDPSAPRVAATYNVPGRLLNVLDDGRLLTIGYRRIQSEQADEYDCFDRGGLVLGEIEAGPVTCIVMEESLNLVRLEGDSFVLEDSYTLEPAAHVVESTVAADRVFVVTHTSGETSSFEQIIVLSELDSGRIDADSCAASPAECVPTQSGFVALGYTGIALQDL